MRRLKRLPELLLADRVVYRLSWGREVNRWALRLAAEWDRRLPA